MNQTVRMLAILVRAALAQFFNSCRGNRPPVTACLPADFLPLLLLAAAEPDGRRPVLGTKLGYALQGVRDSQGCGRH